MPVNNNNNNNNNKKGSRIRTLGDMDLLQGSKSVDPKGYKNITGALPVMKVAHIPHLPHSDETIALLRRIHKEFFPIAQKRGYKVLSLSEMCCCGDGLDHGSESIRAAVGAGTKRRKGGRKRRVMANNVLGYNQSQGNIHTIHLRMRDARNHAVLLPYEEVAGTMSHELAHCVYGPHNAKFYKLMDEIQEQHAVFLAKGVVADTGGFPVGGQQSYVLGRAGTGGGGTTGGTKNPLTAAAAAEARRKKIRWMPDGPQALGGDATFRQWLTPGQAAAGAAEARRLQDEKWCLPCSNDPIDLLDSSSDEEDNDAKLPAAPATRKDEVIDIDEDAKLPAKTGTEDKAPRLVHRITPTNSATSDADQSLFAAADTIDLTGDDDDNDEHPPAVAAMPGTTSAGWTCSMCTFQNHGSNPLLLACSMCGGEKSSAASKTLVSKLVGTRDVASEQLVLKLVRDDAIEKVKQTEVERAKKDFGFNIYGDTKQHTATLPHLT
jgi:hypothetical protein